MNEVQGNDLALIWLNQKVRIFNLIYFHKLTIICILSSKKKIKFQISLFQFGLMILMTFAFFLKLQRMDLAVCIINPFTVQWFGLKSIVDQPISISPIRWMRKVLIHLVHVVTNFGKKNLKNLIYLFLKVKVQK